MDRRSGLGGAGTSSTRGALAGSSTRGASSGITSLPVKTPSTTRFGPGLAGLGQVGEVVILRIPGAARDVGVADVAVRVEAAVAVHEAAHAVVLQGHAPAEGVRVTEGDDPERRVGDGAHERAAEAPGVGLHVEGAAVHDGDVDLDVGPHPGAEDARRAHRFPGDVPLGLPGGAARRSPSATKQKASEQPRSSSFLPSSRRLPVGGRVAVSMNGTRQEKSSTVGFSTSSGTCARGGRSTRKRTAAGDVRGLEDALAARRRTLAAAGPGGAHVEEGGVDLAQVEEGGADVPPALLAPEDEPERGLAELGGRVRGARDVAGADAGEGRHLDDQTRPLAPASTEPRRGSRLNAAPRLAAITRSQSAGSRARRLRLGTLTPVAQTSTSIAPSAASAASTMRGDLGAVGDVARQDRRVARPRRRGAARVSSSLPRSRPTSATRRPASASPTATARPMPPLAPATRAVRWVPCAHGFLHRAATATPGAGPHGPRVVARTRRVRVVSGSCRPFRSCRRTRRRDR